ncbi:lasso peptide biosynthesis B2 protein [Sediminibacterium sp.]|uniref:lasso peptide biosynthesis B2 protein n=1 Tax=Sediminibacterium sp. TaxID=1917865 RepID=UPI003F6EB28F
MKLYPIVLFLEAVMISLFMKTGTILLQQKFSNKFRGKCISSKEIPYYEVDLKTLYLLKQIRAAIKRMNHYTFWETNCLNQSLTGKQMLNRRGLKPTLYIGFRKKELLIEGHAWLKYNNIVLTGAESENNTYTINGTFN